MPTLIAKIVRSEWGTLANEAHLLFASPLNEPVAC